MKLIRIILYFALISTIVGCSISPTCSTFSVSPKMSLEKLKETPNSIEFEKGTVSFYFNVSNTQKEAIYRYNHDKVFQRDSNIGIILAPYIVLGEIVRINTEMGCQTCDYISLEFEQIKNYNSPKNFNETFKAKNVFIVSNNKIIEKIEKDIIYNSNIINIHGIPKDLNISFIVVEFVDENGSKRYLKSNFFQYPEEQKTIIIPNTQAGIFLADQSIVNDWQAKGIAVVGGSIYLSVSDNKSTKKKGSVVKINSSDGKFWSDLGGTLGGLRHPMDSTVEGIAVSGSTVIAVDSADKVYILDAFKGGINTHKTAGGKDVASGAGSFFIVNGMVEKSDVSASTRNPINGMNTTGGIGADNLGNVYAVSGVTIKKADSTGQVQDVITSDLTAPLDVAIDNRNGDIYVLESETIKRFNSKGQLLTTFSNGAINASSIAIDEVGAIYVADTGNSNKDSKVIKFNPSINSEDRIK
jgi:hypothetical protein